MEAIVEIPMDAELKRQVENFYQKRGTSFAEAVRRFARQSLREESEPEKTTASRRSFGIAKGKFFVADDFDEDGDEMARLFGAEA